MTKNKNKNRNGNNKNKNAKGKKTTSRKRPKEIVFDPEARRDYLRGFSERKKQKRAYGLAMQKVKDRKAKLESRKELRAAELEQIEEAERLKEQAQLNQTVESEEEENGSDDASSSNEKEANEDERDNTTTTYQDDATQQQWGGDVVVTTSMNLLDSDDDEDEAPPKKQQRTAKHKSRDTEQEYAGNVEKFLAQLKQKMPAKSAKKAAAGHKQKGKHGAANMKGIGGSTVMKIAQKELARSKSKGGKKKGKRWCDNAN